VRGPWEMAGRKEQVEEKRFTLMPMQPPRLGKSSACACGAKDRTARKR